MKIRSKKRNICVFAIFFILIVLIFQLNLFDEFKINEVHAASNITCSLNNFLPTVGEDVTLEAIINFSATNVWAVIMNKGTILQTVDLETTDNIHYNKDITTTSSYTGRNDVAIYATNSETGETSTCNPSDGSSWQQMSLQDIPWHSRYKHQVVSFKGKLWIFGGYSYGDVWSSVDGLKWTEVTSSAPWGPRYEHRAIVYDDKIWLMGGASSGIIKNDIWSSEDGINWTQVTSSADWSIRTSFGLTVFNNEMWLTGGCDGIDESFNCNHSVADVWHSSDGETWTLATNTPAWSSRVAHGLLSYDDGSGMKLWIIGGLNYPGPSYLNDVWYSSNGSDWTQKTASANWTARSGNGFIVFNDGSGNKMWMMGGRTSAGTFYNDIWSSSDGSNWTQVADPVDYPLIGTQPSKWVSWSARQYSGLVIHNDGLGNKLWVIGGRFGRILSANDVWKSSDGVNWDLVGENYNAEFGRRIHSQLVTFKNKMWLIGGYTELPSGLPQDIWSSTDGVHWTCEIGSYTLETNGISCNNAIPSPFWQGRWGHSVFVYDNKIWLLGGCKDYTSLLSGYSNCSNANLLTDVWYTTDGTTWTQAANVNWPVRFGQEVKVYNDKIWMMGGISQSAGYYHDIWYTTDPTITSNWTSSPTAGWSARAYHRSVVFDNGSGEKLWVIGGYDNNRKTDSWYTSDPAQADNWVQASSDIGWGLYGFGLLNYENKLFAIAGSWDDIVRSTYNGVDWDIKNNDPGWDKRDFGTATIFKNRMWYTTGESGSGVRNDVWASQIGLYFIISDNEEGQINITGTIDPVLTLNLPLTSCNLGVFSESNIKTCNYQILVSTNGDLGYTGYVRADGLLRTGSSDIDNASGIVVAGTESYGISTTESDSVDITRINDANSDLEQNVADCIYMDNNTVSASASALSENDQSFASDSGPVSADSTYLCHAAAISGLTPAGYYSQTVTITVVSNF